MMTTKALRAALLGLGLVGLFAAPAAAQMRMGDLSSGHAYVSASGLYAVPEDADIEGGGVPSGAELELDEDFGFIATLGWHTTMGLRGELEFSWHETDTENLVAPGTVIPVSEDIGVAAGMFNVLYEFSVYNRFSPYGGAGLGLAHFDADIESGISNDGSSTKLAWQGIAGIAYDLSDNLSLTTDYRYFSMIDDPSFSGAELDYNSHRFTAGLRFNLN